MPQGCRGSDPRDQQPETDLRAPQSPPHAGARVIRKEDPGSRNDRGGQLSAEPCFHSRNDSFQSP